MKITSLAIRFLKSKHKLLDISSYFHLPHVLAYPNSASIEVSNLCNLRCPVCENTNISCRPKGSMSFENFKIIMDEIGPYLEDLELHNWGESFLNKDIYEMFCYARKVSPRCYIYLDTNGHFINPQKLFICPPDELVFSIDGLDQKTYEKYRVRGKLEIVLNNLRNCIEMKNKLKTEKPKFIIKFICMKHNEHQLNQIADFAKANNADGYRIELFTSRTVQHAREFMSNIPAYQKYDPRKLGEGLLSPYLQQLNTPCSIVWRNTNIYWNGDVVPCCTDYDSLFSWGNIFKEKSFWKVWNGKKAQSFRLLHRQRKFRDHISICKGCYLMNYRIIGPKELEETMFKSGRYHNLKHN